MSFLQLSWKGCWRGLGAEGDGDGLMRRLMRAYEEPHRHYHTLQHLTECLQLLEANRDLAEEAAEVAMALWFHDAIYNVRASDNEDRSAGWANAELAKSGVADERIGRVCQLIMATRHPAAPSPGDQALLVDIDLAILGASPERFEEYEKQIRKEYAWVPGFVFRRKRRIILQKFLTRPTIYSTPRLGSQLEDVARTNLNRSLRL